MKNSTTLPDWFVFEIPVRRLVRYLEHKTLRRFPQPAACEEPCRYAGLRASAGQRLHLNVGIPGIEDPEDPVEENIAAVYDALLEGRHSIEVILSGEWEIAVKAGLITGPQMRLHERALAAACADLRRRGLRSAQGAPQGARRPRGRPRRQSAPA